MKRIFLILIILTLHQLAYSQEWWKKNNLRVIQFNLPNYEAATLNPDSAVADLVKNSANTVIINAGGIMAFYPTKLDFHYANPYNKPNTLRNVIKKCHDQNIRVIVRFDFSRVHESIFKAHPDWCYISPKGERIINTNMYVVSINAPYVQEKAFDIIAEVMKEFPIDGVFLNMPGYQVNNAYEGKYHGIDQNDYDKKAFTKFSGGLDLPKEEKKEDSVYQKYLQFKKLTVEAWSKKLYEQVKAANKNVAICTYTDRYVDIIRHESQASPLPYWPYTASDNVSNASHTFPGHIISNASIQQISFQSRYNAVEPEETSIRLYENIANGSGLDMSMMGDMQGYEDERSYPVFQKIYGYHKKHEKYFGCYESVADVALIAPGSWPKGKPMEEYRGLQLMFKEAHVQFDIFEDAQIVNVKEHLKKYKVVVFPDINYINRDQKKVIEELLAAGVNLVATNGSFADDPVLLEKLFGAKMVKRENDGEGNYLDVRDRGAFPHLPGQTMISWKYNLGLYDFDSADKTYLPILAKGRPGPPEIIGGHNSTGNYAMGVKHHAKAKALLLPVNIGRLYYLQGYEQHKNIFLDALRLVDPKLDELIQTNAPARVEIIYQNFKASPYRVDVPKGSIVHLVNLTGFSGNTYFSALPVMDINVKIRTAFKPKNVFLLSSSKKIVFTYDEGYVNMVVPKLGEFESVVMER